MKIQRTGSAHWNGGIWDGRGSLSLQSGALTGHPYGFGSRFEGKAGSNPEELLGAAHAACFTMALSILLEEAHLRAEAIDTAVQVTIEQVEGGFAITGLHIDLQASIPGIGEQAFHELAGHARLGCPVSKVLRAPVTLTASLRT